MILVLRVPKTIVRFSGSREGLRELRTAALLTVIVYYSRTIQIIVSKAKSS